MPEYDLFPYVVRQGDHLRKLAHRRGCDPDEVWNHPRNKHLASTRADGDALLPGDILYLPAADPVRLDVSTAQANSYTAHVPYMTIDTIFEDVDGPMSNEPCRVFGVPGVGDDGRSAQADPEGRLVLQVPVTVQDILITFDQRHQSFQLRVGHMDPLEELAGVSKQLSNLGFLDIDFVHGEGDLRAALRLFQANAGLPATGQLDDQTINSLRTAVGNGGPT